MTLFAFDAGEGISTHAAPGDAMVYVLDGEAQITIGGAAHTVPAGSAIIMPAGIPHAVQARTPFKMLLTVVKSELNRADQHGDGLCPEIPGAQFVSLKTPGADRKRRRRRLRPAVYSARAFQQGAAAFSRIR